MTLKPGQTVKVGEQWGTVSYLIGSQMVVVTLDDMSQVRVGLENVKVVELYSSNEGQEAPKQQG